MTRLRRALVLGITADYDFAAGSFLAGFFRHNPDFDGDVVVLNDGLPEAARAALARLAPRLRLEPFDTEILAARLAEASGGAPPEGLAQSLGHWSPMVYTKFEMLRWFDRYDAMVACDVDMLVQAPVPDLWQLPGLGWRPLPEGARKRRSGFFRAFPDLAAGGDLPLANGGLIAAGPDLRDRFGLGAAEFYRAAAEIFERMGTAPAIDELALYLMAKRHALPVTPLGLELNHPVAQTGSGQARIIHAIGPDKFWNALPLRQTCPEWAQNHRLWVEAGGRPAPEAREHRLVHPAEPDLALTFARNRGFWQGLWQHGLGAQIPPGLWPDLRSERPFLRLHLSGRDPAVFLEIARTASDRRMRVSAGFEKMRITEPSFAAGLDAALARIAPAEGLKRHDGRRLLQWSTEAPLADVPALLARLQACLQGEPAP